MKLFRAFLAAALLLAAPAFAGSYTITTTAGQDAFLAKALIQINKQTCVSAGLPAGCSNALLQVSDATKSIIPDVPSFIKYLATVGATTLKAQADADAQSAFLAASQTLTQAQKDAACAAAGLAAGCLP